MSHPRYPSDAYVNRELSWIDFNRRVLDEARDPSNPLLERLKFLAISANNLDEFFEIRVSGLHQAVLGDVEDPGPDALTSNEQLRGVCDKARAFYADQYELWNGTLRPELAAAGLHIGAVPDLFREHESELVAYLEDRLLPVLTPIVIDPAHPFPRIENKALCVGALLKRPGIKGARLGVVTVPRVLPRLVAVKGAAATTYVFVGELVKHFIARVFPGCDVVATAEFRITRNSDLYIDEDGAQNLLDAVNEALRERKKGDPVRLEIGDDAAQQLESMLMEAADLTPDLVFRVPGPVNLNRLMTAYGLVNRPDLKFPTFVPAEPGWSKNGKFSFERLASRDVLLHHPFDSFNTISAFLAAAAADPQVHAIKITLYRTGDDSPIVDALKKAARAGKQVTAIVELKARFDEATNIQWVRELEDAGAQVAYGVVGLKTHCKLALVVRDEGDRFVRYAHLGTGNYNPTTARIYTDVSLLTADESLTLDVANVFNMLTSFSRPESWNHLLVAPDCMLTPLLRLIEAETKEARAGRPARIIAKTNGLVDRDIIDALYDASRAGVDIDLIVRGICSLRAEVPGLSDRIRVRSMVGRFLEHSRIYWFLRSGTPGVWVGSADLMTRNMRGRVEVLFPILDPLLARHIRSDILGVYLDDRPKIRELGADGIYRALPSDAWTDGRDPHAIFMTRAAQQPEGTAPIPPPAQKPRRVRAAGSRRRPTTGSGGNEPPRVG